MMSHHHLKTWLLQNGGLVHPAASFKQVASGSTVIASENIAADSTIVSCPHNLVITSDLALDALCDVLGSNLHDSLKTWSTRQLIASYLSFHSIVDANSSLAHREYINSLPSRDKLRTPLHFTPLELALLKGSNLYGATLDRERDWQKEWEESRDLIAGKHPEWAELLTWELYLNSATYLSSRAFPSTILSRTPSLVADGTAEPILLPGIDSLNHARGEPVSWVSNYIGAEAATPASISLILHNNIQAGKELFNNYGPKPNAELILGYGFSLPDNPDDTIVLKIGGMGDKKWEVGRNASGAEGLWDNVLATVAQVAEPTYEDYLDASGMLSEMAQTLLEKLPEIPDQVPDGVREDVAHMVQHYIQGQRDILEGLIAFAASKEGVAVAMAQEQGIEVVLE